MEWRENMQLVMIGRPVSESTRLKLSIAQQGRTAPLDVRLKTSRVRGGVSVYTFPLFVRGASNDEIMRLLALSRGPVQDSRMRAKDSGLLPVQDPSEPNIAISNARIESQKRGRERTNWLESDPSKVNLLKSLIDDNFINCDISVRQDLLGVYEYAKRSLPSDFFQQLRLEAWLKQITMDKYTDPMAECIQRLGQGLSPLWFETPRLETEENFLFSMGFKGDIIANIRQKYDRYMHTTAFWSLHVPWGETDDAIQYTMVRLLGKRNFDWPINEKYDRSRLVKEMQQAWLDNVVKKRRATTRVKKEEFFSAPWGANNGDDSRSVEDYVHARGFVHPSAEEEALGNLEPEIKTSSPERDIIRRAMDDPTFTYSEAARQLAALSGSSATHIRSLMKRDLGLKGRDY